MKHEFTTKVYYGDTDSYGVVWHGSYIKWFEKGRCDFCENLGMSHTELFEQDIAMPVAKMSFKFKNFAKIDDTIVVETKISKLSPLCITFEQTIKNKESGAVCVCAEYDIITVNKQGKLYRRIPEIIKTKLEKAIK